MFSLRLSRGTIGLVIFAAAAVVLLLLSSVRIAGAANPVPRTRQKPNNQPDIVLDVKAQLDNNDPVDPVHNQPCKRFIVPLKKGKTYVIDMASRDFDAYLRLEDGQGKQIGEDDDGGKDLDAQIVLTPDADGKYTVIATRFDGAGAGNFTIKVQSLHYKTGTAQPLKMGELKIADKLAEGDAIDPLGPKGQYRCCTVKMRAGKTYTIDMASTDFDTFLRLVDSKFCTVAEDDDTAGGVNGTDSRITFTPTTDGEYHIIATTLDDVGSYTLTIREQN